jgi:anti-sigma B factor antagonist
VINLRVERTGRIANMAVNYEIQLAENDVTVASLTGQLNLGNRLMDFEHQIKQRIEEGSRKMVLDLSGLTYIDSAGLGMVATCAGIMVKAGGKFAVVVAGGKIAHMFEITRLNRVIGVFPDLTSATAAVSGPSKAAPGA